MTVLSRLLRSCIVDPSSSFTREFLLIIRVFARSGFILVLLETVRVSGELLTIRAVKIYEKTMRGAEMGTVKVCRLRFSLARVRGRWVESWREVVESSETVLSSGWKRLWISARCENAGASFGASDGRSRNTEYFLSWIIAY